MLSAFCAAAIAIAGYLVTDAYLGLATWTYATGVQGLVFGQTVASISVVAYFLRDRRGHCSWRVVFAPVLGALGLVVGLIMIVGNFEITTGMDGAVNWILLAPTPLLSGGVAQAALPAVYADLGTQQAAHEHFIERQEG